MLLEVLLGGSDHLDGRKLEAAVLKAGDDGADEATLLEVLAMFIMLFVLLFRLRLVNALFSIE